MGLAQSTQTDCLGSWSPSVFSHAHQKCQLCTYTRQQHASHRRVHVARALTAIGAGFAQLYRALR